MNKRYFLYDADAISGVSVELFSAQFHRENLSLIDEGMGRAPVHFVRIAERECVLRHYRRGGLIGRLVQDRYLWLGLENTRAWREWRLLSRLWRQNMPVPRPVATQVVRQGMVYSADLITEKIPQTLPLSRILQLESSPDSLWSSVGAVVARFHRAGVYHADLNAHNVLVAKDGGIYLIDFDRGQMRRASASWQSANIARLRRSLDKLNNSLQVFYFDDGDWSAFLSAYHSGLNSGQ